MLAIGYPWLLQTERVNHNDLGRSQKVLGEFRPDQLSVGSSSTGRKVNSPDDVRQDITLLSALRPRCQIRRLYCRQILHWTRAARVLFPLHGRERGPGGHKCEDCQQWVSLEVLINQSPGWGSGPAGATRGD